MFNDIVVLGKASEETLGGGHPVEFDNESMSRTKAL